MTAVNPELERLTQAAKQAQVNILDDLLTKVRIEHASIPPAESSPEGMTYNDGIRAGLAWTVGVLCDMINSINFGWKQ